MKIDSENDMKIDGENDMKTNGENNMDIDDSQPSGSAHPQTLIYQNQLQRFCEQSLVSSGSQATVDLNYDFDSGTSRTTNCKRPITF